MKALITICVLAVGLIALAQNGKGNGHGKDDKGKGNSSVKINQGKGNISIKQRGNSGKSQIKLKPGKGGKDKSVLRQGNNGNKGNKAFKAQKFHYKKGHVNHLYMYEYDPVVYPTKNYGQWRSQQARNKHKKYKPLVEKDARNAIVMINNRNAFLVIEIGEKIDRFERLVVARHNTGGITDLQFSLQMGVIDGMRKRQAQFSFYASN